MSLFRENKARIHPFQEINKSMPIELLFFSDLTIKGISRSINKKIINKDGERMIDIDSKTCAEIITEQRNVAKSINEISSLLPDRKTNTFGVVILKATLIYAMNELYTLPLDHMTLPNKINHIIEFQKVLNDIRSFIKYTINERINNPEDLPGLTEFETHIKLFIAQKKIVENDIRKRNILRAKQKIIKRLMIKIISDEMVATSDERKINRDLFENSEDGGLKTQLLVQGLSSHILMEDEEYLDLIYEIEHMTREIILGLNYGTDSLSNLRIFERKKKFNQVTGYEINRDEYKEVEKKKLRIILNNLLKQSNINTAIAKFIQNFSKSDKLHLNVLLELLTENECELDESERSDHNYLGLYTQALLGNQLFHKLGYEAFTGASEALVIMGLLNDKSYDPETFPRKMTDIFVLKAFAMRRAQDTETDSSQRSIVVEEAQTYYQWFKKMLTGSNEITNEEIQNIKNLVDKFWWNEVGRPYVEYKMKLNPKTSEYIIDEDEDEYGPIVKNISNKENVQYPVSKEHGKYEFRKRLTKEAIERLHKLNQSQFGALTIYFQLQEMVNGRRNRTDKKTGIGVEDVPLPKRDYYYVTQYSNERWKKLKIDGKFFTSYDYGKHGSPEALRKFLYHYMMQFVDQNDWQKFDEKRLQKEAKNAYSTKSKHREKYQDTIEMISDLNDFTASDLGLYYMDDSVTQAASPLISSLLTSTFGGRKQVNFVMGLNNEGFITQVVETIAHKFCDGNPARVESELVLNSSLNALEGLSAKFQNDDLNVQLDPINAVPKNNIVMPDQILPEKNKNLSVIYTGKIEGVVGHDTKGKEITFRNKCNEIFKFYNKKRGAKIDKNTIIQLAIHLFTNLSYTHFLESRNGILFPAMSFCPTKFLEKLKKGSKLNMDEMLEFIAATQILRADRKSNGIIPVNAMLPGAHSESAGVRKLLQNVGKFTHEQLVIPLIESVLVSSVSGSKNPIPSDKFFPQDLFTTAIDGVYLKYGALGFNDYGDDIIVTYRKISDQKETGEDQKDLDAQFNKEFNLCLKIVMDLLFEGMRHFENDDDMEADEGWENEHKKQKEISRTRSSAK